MPYAHRRPIQGADRMLLRPTIIVESGGELTYLVQYNEQYSTNPASGYWTKWFTSSGNIPTLLSPIASNFEMGKTVFLSQIWFRPTGRSSGSYLSGSPGAWSSVLSSTESITFDLLAQDESPLGAIWSYSFTEAGTHVGEFTGNFAVNNSCSSSGTITPLAIPAWAIRVSRTWSTTHTVTPSPTSNTLAFDGEAMPYFLV